MRGQKIVKQENVLLKVSRYRILFFPLLYFGGMSKKIKFTWGQVAQHGASQFISTTIIKAPERGDNLRVVKFFNTHVKPKLSPRSCCAFCSCIDVCGIVEEGKNKYCTYARFANYLTFLANLRGHFTRTTKDLWP